MNADKWLKRKYTESYDKIKSFLNNEELKYFKERKMKIGILEEDVDDWRSDTKYKKGTMFMYQHQKDCDEEGWTGDFRYYCIFKNEIIKESNPWDYNSSLHWRLKFKKIEK